MKIYTIFVVPGKVDTCFWDNAKIDKKMKIEKKLKI